MMTKLKSPKQLDQKIQVKVSVSKAWGIFNDLSLRPKWTCDVQKIDYTNQMTKEGEVAITYCLVNGKEGTLMTRCLALESQKRGEFLVEKDSFGFNNMLLDIGFATTFKVIGSNLTEISMQSHYQPKNVLLKLMNPLIKKKMRKEVDLMMQGLKDYMETGQVNMLNPVNQK